MGLVTGFGMSTASEDKPHCHWFCGLGFLPCKVGDLKVIGSWPVPCLQAKESEIDSKLLIAGALVRVRFN